MPESPSEQIDEQTHVDALLAALTFESRTARQGLPNLFITEPIKREVLMALMALQERDERILPNRTIIITVTDFLIKEGQRCFTIEVVVQTTRNKAKRVNFKMSY